jgi:ubiquinone/menaquinone biosynthesis C-methylase UbiE
MEPQENMIELSQSPEEIKSCCATLYESSWASWLLGDSFHPGGLALTKRLGQLMQLQPGQRLLDVAAGKGTSAIFLAQEFGCRVVGVDYSTVVIAEATTNAEQAGLGDQVCFEQGDAEGLQFETGSFDAIICECAFCTFPDKSAAVLEFARVLRPGGRIGLSDLTRTGTLPPELDTLLAWVACIADALTVEDYAVYLEGAGLTVDEVDLQAGALAEMIRNVQFKLLGTEVLVKLNKIELDLAQIDLDQAKSLVHHAAQAVREDKLGYVLLAGKK